MNAGYREHGFQMSFGRGLTWAVQRLIVWTTVVFAVQLVLYIPLGAGRPGSLSLVTDWLAFEPDKLFALQIWRPFTYLFIHQGLSHLFFNMLWLFFFGPEVERVLGTRQFFRFYLFCGAVGVLATLFPYLAAFLFAGAPAPQPVSVVGASGATMGVLMAFATLNPTREIYLFPLPIPIHARALVAIVVIYNLVVSFGSTTHGPGVSVATHFGGLIAGYAWIKLAPRFVGLRFGGTRKSRKVGRKKKPRKDSVDRVGEAVDNIFKFDDERRRRDD
jgi:membrane associated rhomboid family serine protease